MPVGLTGTNNYRRKLGLVDCVREALRFETQASVNVVNGATFANDSV